MNIYPASLSLSLSSTPLSLLSLLIHYEHLSSLPPFRSLISSFFLLHPSFFSPSSSPCFAFLHSFPFNHFLFILFTPLSLHAFPSSSSSSRSQVHLHRYLYVRVSHKDPGEGFLCGALHLPEGPLELARLQRHRHGVSQTQTHTHIIFIHYNSCS